MIALVHAGTPPSSCPAKGEIVIADSGQYKGRAYDLLKIERLRSMHLGLTSNDATWIRQLDGPSPENRLYRGENGAILIFSTCKPRMCDKGSLYGAFDEDGNTYGIEVIENKSSRVLGVLSTAAQSAIRCAKLLDQRLVEATRRKIRENAR